MNLKTRGDTMHVKHLNRGRFVVNLLSIVFLTGCFWITPARAAVNRWTNASDGVWADATSWSLGVAPSNHFVTITNAGTKTVTITASTLSDNLTISNLLVYGASTSATNTLVLSSNAAPLTILSTAAGGLTVGGSTGPGVLRLESGNLVTPNCAVAISGNMITSNGTWQGKDAFVGSGGTLTVVGGTNAIFDATAGNASGLVLGYDASTGSVFVTGGLLDVTNACLGRLGVGHVTVLGGVWRTAGAISLGGHSTGPCVGSCDVTLAGGSNLFASGPIRVGASPGSVGSILLTGGAFVTSSSLLLGYTGEGYMTVSGGVWSAAGVNIGSSGGQGMLVIAGGSNDLGNVIVGGAASSKTGMVFLTNGYLQTAECDIGNTAGATGTMSVSSGTWRDTISVRAGQFGRGSLTISGGTCVWPELRVGNRVGGVGDVVMTGGLVTTPNVYLGANATSLGQGSFLLSHGGVLEVNRIVSGTSGSGVFTNQNGGILQFTTATPTITTNTVGSIVVNNAVIAFRAVTDVNVKGNWSGTQLANMTFAADSQNAFRLNASTNATAPEQSYTFATGLGGTNYSRLELLNGSLYRGGSNVVIGANGSLLVSNGVSRINGALSFASTASLDIDVSSTNGYGCLVATNVALGNCTLNLNLGPAPVLNTPLMIISNTSSGVISGQFANGSRWETTVNGTTYVLNTAVANGSGVVLTTRLQTLGTRLMIQ